MLSELEGKSKAPFGGAVGMDLDAIYETVDLVYQSVERPEKLATALGAVARLVGIEHVVLLAVAGDGERRVLGEGHGDPAGGARALETTPSGSHRVMPSTRTIPLSGGYELVLGAAELSPPALAGLLRVTPHLSRALRLADRIAAHGPAAVHSALALDRLLLGVILLGSDGCVLASNRAARSIVSSSALIEMRESRVAPTQAVQRTLFETMVEHLLAPATQHRRLAGGQLELHAPGRATVHVIVVPYFGKVEHGEAACAVLLSSPGAAAGPEELFAQRYHLSPAEARVATLLVAGRDPVAALPEIAPQIVRGHQERVFAKLGSTRQGDLVRLLLRPPGVLFEGASGA